MSASSHPHHANERQWSVNDFKFCIVGILCCELLHTVINSILASFIGKKVCCMVTAPFWKWVTMEHQQFLVLQHWYSELWIVAHCYKRHIGSLYRQKGMRYGHCPLLTMSVNRASTIFGYASWVIWMAMSGNNSYTMYWLSFQSKQCRISLLPHHDNERQWSVNDFWSCKSGN